MMGLVSKIVGIAIGLFVAAVIMPVALYQIAQSEANLTAGGTDTTVIMVFTVLLPILAVVGLAMYFLPRRG